MNTPVKIQLGEAGLGVGGKPENGNINKQNMGQIKNVSYE